MTKVNQEFVQQSFKGAINNYKKAVEEIALWESEEYIFTKYFEKDKSILDLGCGTGRTTFAYVLFAFNGLMQIPKQENRIKAMKEIRRVLQPGGIFVFTTHDRDADKKFLDFWEEEKKIWSRGEQDKRLYEFGDRIAKSKNEKRDIFIHIPDREEVLTCLEEADLICVEDFYRDDLFDESREIKKFSGECRFWVVKKAPLPI